MTVLIDFPYKDQRKHYWLLQILRIYYPLLMVVMQGHSNLYWRWWMYGVSGPGDYCVEATVTIIFILHLPDCTVWLDQGVLPFNDVTVSFFWLFFDVACMTVFYAVFKFVLRICLKTNNKRLIKIIDYTTNQTFWCLQFYNK